MRLNCDYMDLDSLFEQYQEKVPDSERLTRNEVKRFEAIFHKLAEVSNGGWVSVKDRLPDNEQDVLAYLDDGEETRIAPCNYANGVWFDCVMNCVVVLRHITHWMPMPELPKEEDGE